MWNGRLFCVGAIFASALLAGGAPWAQAQERREARKVLAALHEMREARTELREAKHDFGGHRDKALRAVDTAISETEGALRAARMEVRTEPPRKEAYKEYTNYPHLRHTLRMIKEAREDLREARHDFGGHRDKALKALEFAAEQVEQTLKFAR